MSVRFGTFGPFYGQRDVQQVAGGDAGQNNGRGQVDRVECGRQLAHRAARMRTGVLVAVGAGAVILRAVFAPPGSAGILARGVRARSGTRRRMVVQNDNAWSQSEEDHHKKRRGLERIAGSCTGNSHGTVHNVLYTTGILAVPKGRRFPIESMVNPEQFQRFSSGLPRHRFVWFELSYGQQVSLRRAPSLGRRTGRRNGMRAPVWIIVLLSFIIMPGLVWAQDVNQSDWSGGGGVPGPVGEWGDRFDTASGISWLSVPGRLALSSSPLESPVDHLIDDSYQGTIGVGTGDIDGDGDIDVVGTAQTSGLVLWWENDGANPPGWTEHTVATPAGAAGVDVADIDGDGRLDIVIMCVAPRNRLLWRRNLGGDPITWENQVIQDPWLDAWELSTGDVDGDGHLDVLCTGWSMADIAWWKNGGDYPITWTQYLVDGSIQGAHSVRPADLDGDGDTDLAAAAGIADTILVYWNDGGDPPAWTQQVLETEFDGARSVWIGDIDQDGDLDVAGICWNSDLAWWSNGGGGPVTWTRQTISTACSGGHACMIADVNGDGRPDVLGACNVDNKLAWWENGGGDPIVWTERLLSGHYEGSITVRAADLDADGDLDPVSAAYAIGTFDWWEVTQFTSSGELESSILDTEGMSPPASIDWSAEQPTGTEVRFRVRSSDDAGDLGAWSADILTPGNLPEVLSRYVQYEVILDTADPANSPILDRVSFGPALTAVESGPFPQDARTLNVGPNPFNPQATLSFGLPVDQPVRLTVFDIAGRRVRSLADAVFPAGTHSLNWDGSDDGGRALASGMYWVLLETPGNRETRKLVLLR